MCINKGQESHYDHSLDVEDLSLSLAPFFLDDGSSCYVRELEGDNAATLSMVGRWLMITVVKRAPFNCVLVHRFSSWRSWMYWLLEFCWYTWILCILVLLYLLFLFSYISSLLSPSFSLLFLFSYWLSITIAPSLPLSLSQWWAWLTETIRITLSHKWKASLRMLSVFS